MRTFKIGALALALTIATAPVAARALNFTLPPIIPDICPFVSSCITWTQSGTLLAVQQYIAMVQDFKNLHNIAGAQGAIQQVVGGIVHAAEAAPPMQVGNTAAEQVIVTEPDTEARVAAIDKQAQAADGVQQQAQVNNLYQSTIAGEVNKTNALMSEQVKQKKAQDDDAIATYLDEFGPTAEAGGGSTL
jgi:hypothetical protein